MGPVGRDLATALWARGAASRVQRSVAASGFPPPRVGPLLASRTPDLDATTLSMRVEDRTVELIVDHRRLVGDAAVAEILREFVDRAVGVATRQLDAEAAAP